MEVKPGYKQTEVGVIPEEWEVECALDELANSVRPWYDAQDRTAYSELQRMASIAG